MNHRKPHGFTLTELLVAISIVTVLSAILFPVFRGAREKARTATCSANLKQIGTAVQAYVSDWNGRLPDTDPSFWTISYGPPCTATPNANGTGRSRSWQAAIFPYVKDERLYICPSAKRLAPDGSNNMSTDRTGYGWNGAYWKGVRNPCGGVVLGPADNRSGLDGYLKFTKIEDTVNTIMAADSPPSGAYQVGDEDYNTTGCSPQPCGANAPSTLGDTKLPGKRHSEGANILFCDGHVKWLKKITDFATTPSSPDMWSIEAD